MAEIDVRLERVSKVFGDAAAVDDLSLDIEEGEFFSMLGPSGCGKTTTLRMIGGFEEPTAGTVYLGGRDVTDLPPYKRDVNTVFQSYALFPHLDVYENVAFGLGARRSTRARSMTRVNDAMTLVDLLGFEKRKPVAAVGRPAAAGRPGPRAGEPPEGAAAGRAAGRPRPEAPQADAAGAQAHPAGGRHHLRLRDARPGRGHDDVGPLRRHARTAGSSRSAPPESVYESPATEFVAGFLGASNLLDGDAGGPRTGPRAIPLAGRHSACRAATGSPRRHRAARSGSACARRRSRSSPDEGDAAADRNHVSGLLRMATYIGVNYQYKVEGPGGNELTVYVQNLGGRHPAEGGRARPSGVAARAHVRGGTVRAACPKPRRKNDRPEHRTSTRPAARAHAVAATPAGSSCATRASESGRSASAPSSPPAAPPASRPPRRPAVSTGVGTSSVVGGQQKLNHEAEVRELAVLHRHRPRRAPLDRRRSPRRRASRSTTPSRSTTTTSFYAKIRPEPPAGQVHRLRHHRAARTTTPPLGEMIDFGWLIPLDQIEDDELLQVTPASL